MRNRIRSDGTCLPVKGLAGVAFVHSSGKLDLCFNRVIEYEELCKLLNLLGIPYEWGSGRLNGTPWRLAIPGVEFISRDNNWEIGFRWGPQKEFWIALTEEGWVADVPEHYLGTPADFALRARAHSNPVHICLQGLTASDVKRLNCGVVPPLAETFFDQVAV